MIPNIIHFVFGLKEQKEEFLFCYYISILSSKLVNNPEKIYFHYHFEPFGFFWEKTKKIVELHKVDIPEKIGNIDIIYTEHRADTVRINMLKEYGGIYMDIDTISIRPYKFLLTKNFSMCRQKSPKNTLCNAVIFANKNSIFLDKWIDNYAKNFNNKGWGESSLNLPYNLSKIYKNEIYITDSDFFCEPSWDNIENIFYNNIEKIPENLITLHLWNNKSKKYISIIQSFRWIIDNPHTLYSKIILYLVKEYNIHTYDYSFNYLKKYNDITQNKVFYNNPVKHFQLYGYNEKRIFYSNKYIENIIENEKDINSKKKKSNILLKLKNIFEKKIYNKESISEKIYESIGKNDCITRYVKYDLSVLELFV